MKTSKACKQCEYLGIAIALGLCVMFGATAVMIVLHDDRGMNQQQALAVGHQQAAPKGFN